MDAVTRWCAKVCSVTLCCVNFAPKLIFRQCFRDKTLIKRISAIAVEISLIRFCYWFSFLRYVLFFYTRVVSLLCCLCATKSVCWARQSMCVERDKVCVLSATKSVCWVGAECRTLCIVIIYTLKLGTSPKYVATERLFTSLLLHSLIYRTINKLINNIVAVLLTNLLKYWYCVHTRAWVVR